MVTKPSIMRARRGQAFYELMLGLLALTLIAATLFAFTEYIVASLKIQRNLRAKAGTGAMWSIGGDGTFSSASDVKSVSVSSLAAEHVFGKGTVVVREEVHIPNMGGIIIE